MLGTEFFKMSFFFQKVFLFRHVFLFQNVFLFHKVFSFQHVFLFRHVFLFQHVFTFHMCFFFKRCFLFDMCRKSRPTIWFNPPFSSSVKTNICAHFLHLITKHFPKGHRFHKIFNQNNLELSYSTT